MNAPQLSPVLSAALQLHKQHISVIPVNRDKRAALKWNPFREDVPSEDQLKRWFAKDTGGAIVAGAVTCIDIDEKNQQGLAAEYEARVREAGLGDVWDKCIHQSTPSGGRHLVFSCNCTEPVRNLVLSSSAGNKAFIETRGDGGYFLIAPSKGYELLAGDWSQIPELSPAERDDLLDVARSFDEAPHQESEPAKAKTFTGDELKPGDDYDQRGDLPALLAAHGWSRVGQVHWRRPGKDRGISASWNHVPGRFYVFSTSTIFKPSHVYKPWHVFAMLQHGGDFRAAATALATQGYGTPLKKQQLDTKAEKASLEQALEKRQTKAEQKKAQEDELLQKALAATFRWDDKPTCGRSLLMLGDTTVATAGNIIGITAQAKAGKTALFSGCIAAALRPGSFLHCSSPDQSGAVLHIDTEQSYYDAHRLGVTIRRRAEIGKGDEPRYIAYHWRDFQVPVRKAALEQACARACKAHGKVHSIWIDGVADLVTSVNDEAECNELITTLMALASRYDCIIALVIHENPGSNAKSRGHLGSNIERKAEANIRLEKNYNSMITSVWGEKMRGKPIPKKDAVCFAWDDSTRRHEVVNQKTETPKRKSRMSQPEAQDKARHIATQCAWKYEEWWQAVMRDTGYTGKDYKTQFRDYALTDQQVELISVKTGKPGPPIKLIGPPNDVRTLRTKMEKECEAQKQTKLTVK